jgi:hypothetical protein
VGYPTWYSAFYHIWDPGRVVWQINVSGHICFVPELVRAGFSSLLTLFSPNFFIAGAQPLLPLRAKKINL